MFFVFLTEFMKTMEPCLTQSQHLLTVSRGSQVFHDEPPPQSLDGINYNSWALYEE